MDATQAARIARAREVLNEKRHAYDPESMAAQMGRLDYWLRDIIGLAAELDDQSPPPSGRASCGHPADADGECSCSSWPERAPVPPGPAAWSSTPALDGYGYQLPDDYLRGAVQ